MSEVDKKVNSISLNQTLVWELIVYFHLKSAGCRKSPATFFCFPTDYL